MAQIAEEWTAPSEAVVIPLVPVFGLVEVRDALQHANAAVSLARIEAADDSVASELDRLTLSKARRLADAIWQALHRADGPHLPKSAAFAEFLAGVVDDAHPLELDEPAAGRMQLLALAAAGEAAWREVEDAGRVPEEAAPEAPAPAVTTQPPLNVAILGGLVVGVVAGLAAIAGIG